METIPCVTEKEKMSSFWAENRPSSSEDPPPTTQLLTDSNQRNSHGREQRNGGAVGCTCPLSSFVATLPHDVKICHRHDTSSHGQRKKPRQSYESHTSRRTQNERKKNVEIIREMILVSATVSPNLTLRTTSLFSQTLLYHSEESWIFINSPC